MAIPATQEDVLSLAELVKRASDLTMMPQVARKVIEMVADQNSSASQLAGILEKDPNITARILKISNSAFYGLRREVKTVQQAIVVLGFKSLRSMVVASSSKALHKRFGITEQMLWDRSIGTAIGGKLLAEGKASSAGELAFVGGLLHNVGKTIMNNECPNGFAEVMRRVYNDGIASVEAEAQIFQYAHPEVGFRISEKWGLPEELCSIIRSHHLTHVDPYERERVYQDSVLKRAMACVEVSSHLCERLGIGQRQPKAEVMISELEGSKILGLDETKIAAISQRMMEVYKQERSVFD
jgi:putative nucleotidyltransferase with HDIG domain